ncbi:MAG: septum formation inhibitor Maf [Nitrospirae bacterium]|nr:septum formation inhibitor Maf [Nitrospirota bacterium]
MYKSREIVLASASPRRKELLEKAGLKFVVDASDFEEDLSLRMSAGRLARYLSCEKAKAVAEKYNNAIIIAADTIISLDEKVFGKPHTDSVAIRMLNILNGRAHDVITGFTIMDTGDGLSVSRSVVTKVYFRKLTLREIDTYVRTGEPLDKAGAYAIQGIGAAIVKKIEGDYNNVVGLPVDALMKELRKFGVYN